ncbi:hypothetical protein M0804_005387 [Polistes exclamans]|nr:hypothetical protein M0804_005387 [Polistes exclamans]
MSGLTPTWYHATNVALHAAACVLVTRVSLTVASLRPGFAALTGLLFAAHPIHTEAVEVKLNGSYDSRCLRGWKFKGLSNKCGKVSA